MKLIFFYFFWLLEAKDLWTDGSGSQVPPTGVPDGGGPIFRSGILPTLVHSVYRISETIGTGSDRAKSALGEFAEYRKKDPKDTLAQFVNALDNAATASGGKTSEVALAPQAAETPKKNFELNAVNPQNEKNISHVNLSSQYEMFDTLLGTGFGMALNLMKKKRQNEIEKISKGRKLSQIRDDSREFTAVQNSPQEQSKGPSIAEMLNFCYERGDPDTLRNAPLLATSQTADGLQCLVQCLSNEQCALVAFSGDICALFTAVPPLEPTRTQSVLIAQKECLVFVATQSQKQSSSPSVEAVGYAANQTEGATTVLTRPVISGPPLITTLSGTAKTASSLFRASEKLVEAGSAFASAFPIQQLLTAGQQLHRSGILRSKGITHFGAPPPGLSKNDLLPPPGSGTPTVYCLHIGMTCCVPEHTARKWSRHPPYLNDRSGVAVCRANFVSRMNALCATTAYDIGESQCGMIVRETSELLSYKVRLTIPSRGMNNAICECHRPKNDKEGGTPEGFATWEYSLKSAKSAADKEKKAAVAEKASANLNQALGFTQFVTHKGADMAASLSQALGGDRITAN